MPRRTLWRTKDFAIVDEPLSLALLKYRQRQDRAQVGEVALDGEEFVYPGAPRPNLISSKTTSGRHKPVLDLDFPHTYVASSTPGHGHLYLDVEISRFRWFVLMCALRFAKVIEMGFFVWSLRRGANFLRLRSFTKSGGADSTKYTYGWFRKLKEYR